MKNCLFPATLIAMFVAANSDSVHAASHIWSGVVNGNWSVAGNWSSGGAPTNGESPLHLTFPPTATRFTVTNDITGLQVDSLTLTNGNYALHALPGKAITLKGTAGTNLLCTGDCVLESSLGVVLSNTNVIHIGANQQLTVKGPISGSGALAKVGAGALNFQGVATNSYTGNTLLLQGNLNLQRGSALNSPALAVPGAIFVGTRTGALNSAVVNLNFSHQLVATGAVFSYKSGRLSLAPGVAQKIGPVKMEGGLIAGNPNSLLTLLGDVTATNSGSVSCPMSLGGTNRTFTVHGGTSWFDLEAEIQDGGNNAGLTKLGQGSLSLGRSNNYGGLTLVTEGTLNIEHPFALGRTNAGTVVTNAGALRFIGSFTAGEALTLGGFGTWNTGTIYADVDTNIWTGPVTLVADTRMYVLMPHGKVIFTGPISGPGALDLAGDGTLVFAGNAANAYSGTTSVSSGRLLMAKTNAITVAGPLVIGDDETPTNNAIVRLLNQHQIGDAAPVTIHASGWLDLSAAAPASDVVGSLAGSGKRSASV